MVHSMIVPKNTAPLAVLQLQMEIVYNVNTEFLSTQQKILSIICL